MASSFEFAFPKECPAAVFVFAVRLLGFYTVVSRSSTVLYQKVCPAAFREATQTVLSFEYILQFVAFLTACSKNKVEVLVLVVASLRWCPLYTSDIL